MDWFGSDRRRSWQRFALTLLWMATSTVLLVTFYIDDAVWAQVNIAALGIFGGSETVRHFARIRYQDKPAAEPYGPAPAPGAPPIPVAEEVV